MFPPLHCNLQVALCSIVTNYFNCIVIYCNLHNVLKINIAIKWTDSTAWVSEARSKTGYNTVQKNDKVTFRIYSCST